MGERVRWRLTAGGATMACLGSNNSSTAVDPTALVRAAMAEEPGPTSALVRLLGERHPVAEGNHAAGDRVFRVHPEGEGGFEAYREVAYEGGEELVERGYAGRVPPRLVDDMPPPEATTGRDGRRLIGFQFADAEGRNVAGKPDDPFGGASFEVMAPALAVAEAAKAPGHLLVPVFEGDVEHATVVGEDGAQTVA